MDSWMVKAQQQQLVCAIMHRIVQRRRAGPLRSAWSLLGAVALALTAASAVFTVWTWRQTRDLTRSVQTLRHRLDQVDCPS